MHFRFVVALVFALFASSTGIVLGEDAAPPEAVTTADPAMPSDELALILVPLTKDELVVEADGWQTLVKSKAEEIAHAEIAVKRQNQEIQKANEIQEQSADVKEALAEVREEAEEAKASGNLEAIENAEQAATEAQAQVDDLHQTVADAADAAEKTAEMKERMSDETKQRLNETSASAGKATDAVERIEEAVDTAEGAEGDDLKVAAEEARTASAEAVTATGQTRENAEQALIAGAADSSHKLARAEEAAESSAETKKEEKNELLDRVNELREERIKLVDNLRAAVDELERKSDLEDGDIQARIKDYRLYISGVSGIHVDVTDATSAMAAISGWVISEEGGLRWVINIAKFFSILIIAWFLSRFFSGMMRRAMNRVSWPTLLQHFLISTVRWVVMIFGVIMALSTLEVSVGPLLALVGAAGFIVAFALQDSLSNFASGLMILFFRPFDVGDVIDAGGVSGKVTSMHLVATTIKTFDNKDMIVPNNSIVGNVITNATRVTERRVDMEFGIGYDDDIDQTLALLEDIVVNHPKILKTPAPTIKMNTLADSSVNFICRPWAKTSDYWDVYWDVTKEVKRRFDAANIGIPYPQQDVHLYLKNTELSQLESLASPTAAPAPRVSPKREDGGLDRSD